LTARRLRRIIPRQEDPRMIRPLLLATLAGGPAAACATLTPAQQDRNNALWTAARSCENGSLTVSRMSTEGVPYTQTMNSSGFEFPIFEACYREKAAPIWGAYCKAEPGSAQCRR
jgi:hypothetical protein